MVIQVAAGLPVVRHPLITETLPFERAVEAFDLASDRKAQMKVQLTFEEQ
jgi:threonine dehydrogenase-like Zn-dependent dehydrogenase